MKSGNKSKNSRRQQTKRRRQYAVDSRQGRNKRQLTVDGQETEIASYLFVHNMLA
jgi:hypothetical protein